MQELEEEFTRRGITVLAISQEDRSLEELPKILRRLEGEPWFSILGDIGYTQTRRYARTTAYLIDAEGVVRQVFPMETYVRASWWAVLGEVDRLRTASEPAVPEPDPAKRPTSP